MKQRFFEWLKQQLIEWLNGILILVGVGGGVASAYYFKITGLLIYAVLLTVIGVALVISRRKKEKKEKEVA